MIVFLYVYHALQLSEFMMHISGQIWFISCANLITSNLMDIFCKINFIVCLRGRKFSA